jgi:heme exporter protein B
LRRDLLPLLQKEFRTEFREKAAFSAAFLLSFAALVSLAQAAYNEKLNTSLAAGLFWVAMNFAAVVSLPRSFVGEEDQGTFDLLRLTARPESVFLAKYLFCVAQVLLAAIVLGALFFPLVGMEIKGYGVMLLSILGGAMSLAGSVCLCGALVTKASNRHLLASAIATPLVIPIIVMGVQSTRAALGYPQSDGGMMSSLGIVCYGVLTATVGPTLFAWTWKN